MAHAAGMATLQGLVPDSSVGAGEATLREATARGTAVNYGGVAVGVGGEAVPCWALDDFGLTNVTLLKINAVRSLVAVLNNAGQRERQRTRLSTGVVAARARRHACVCTWCS